MLNCITLNLKYCILRYYSLNYCTCGVMYHDCFCCLSGGVLTITPCIVLIPLVFLIMGGDTKQTIIISQYAVQFLSGLLTQSIHSITKVYGTHTITQTSRHTDPQTLWHTDTHRIYCIMLCCVCYIVLLCIILLYFVYESVLCYIIIYYVNLCYSTL